MLERTIDDRGLPAGKQAADSTQARDDAKLIGCTERNHVEVAADGLILLKSAVADIQLGKAIESMAGNGAPEGVAGQERRSAAVAAFGLVFREGAVADGQRGDIRRRGSGGAGGGKAEISDGAAPGVPGDAGARAVSPTLGPIAGKCKIRDDGGSHSHVEEASAKGDAGVSGFVAGGIRTR